MLTDIDFQVVYASGENEPAEFYLDALLESKYFDLGLGYFSSSGFQALAHGFAFFLSQGGKVRIIINDVLSPEDKSAIEKGLKGEVDTIVQENILNDITALAKTLSKKDAHFFKCLSWLISQKRLEIIAIIPSKSDGKGIAHQKFGIFRDEHDNKVVFTGSPNFSKSALVYNIETLSCYKSWTGEQMETSRVDYYRLRFNNIWSGQNKNVKIIPIDKVKEVITDKFPVSGLEELIHEEEIIIDDLQASGELSEELTRKIKALKAKLNSQILKKDSPTIPTSFEIRDYQQKAIDEWIKSQYQGFYEMATGTGKTITSLLSSVFLYRKLRKIFILVLVPTKDLAIQWSREVELFNYKEVNLISSDAPNWKNTLTRVINSFKLGSIDEAVFIATYSSFKLPKFQEFINKLPSQTLLIADEAHNMGAAQMLQNLPHSIQYRLGLSATPHRHFDDSGTRSLLKFFNAVEHPTFEFSMKEAIRQKFLCQYKLYPRFVELNEREYEQYLELSKKISKRAHIGEEGAFEPDEYLEKLLRDRRMILNKADGKKAVVSEIIDEMMKKGEIHHTLVYCPEGLDAEEGTSIINDFGKLLGRDKRLSIGKFTGDTPSSERQRLLSEFDLGSIQCLLAMKCLDEGVDVKQTETAIFVSSSTNPRQYVQRRGRVLRTHPKKAFATLYDIIAIPPRRDEEDDINLVIEKKIIKQELSRYQEFAEDAVNYMEAMEPIKPILDKYEITL